MCVIFLVFFFHLSSFPTFPAPHSALNTFFCAVVVVFFIYFVFMLFQMWKLIYYANCIGALFVVVVWSFLCFTFFLGSLLDVCHCCYWYWYYTMFKIERKPLFLVIKYHIFLFIRHWCIKYIKHQNKEKNKIKLNSSIIKKV